MSVSRPAWSGIIHVLAIKFNLWFPNTPVSHNQTKSIDNHGGGGFLPQSMAVLKLSGMNNLLQGLRGGGPP